MDVGVASDLVVGRERELAAIERFLAGAAERPTALVLEGEPGIGKTTLWSAAVDAARAEGRRVLQARPAEAERELSFSALGDLLEPVLSHVEDLPPPRRRALRVALLLAVDEEPALDARAVGLATLDLLRAVAAEQPLLVAVDDLQWLDPPSAEVLAYAFRRLDAEPVGLLGACRPGADDAVRGGRGERLVIDPLSVGALHELIRSRLGVSLTRPTLVRVHETSGGNPFFALELARALDGRELIPGEPLPVPATLADLTAARFARLDDRVHEVLLFVAALAHPTLDLVAAAAGDDAAAALDEAGAAGVIELDGARVRFTHPLLASLHYGSATADERARVHRRLAEVVTNTEERARHLGAATTEPDAEVAQALAEATVAAAARGAPAAAAELAEIALRLTPAGDPALTLARVHAAAEHRFAAGSTMRARALLEDALTWAPRGPERARVALQLAALLDVQEISSERLVLARALHEADGDPILRAGIHARLCDYFANADWRESYRHARRAHDLAEAVGDPKLIAETLALVFDRGFWVGHGIDHALIRRAIELEGNAQLGVGRRPTNAYAFALKWAGDVDRARPLYEWLRELGRAESDIELVYVLFFSTFHELISEDWEAAAQLAHESWRMAVEAERGVDAASGLWACVAVAAYRGETERVRSDAVEAARIAAATGVSDLLFSGLALGVLELSLGDPAAALAAVRPATEEKLSTGVQEPGLFLGFPEHAEAAIAVGEVTEAEELLAWVEEGAQRLDRAWALACCARGRALLAAARRDDAGADAAFAEAYAQHERRPQQLATYELARTLLAHGSILRRRQRKRQANETLERAAAIFERLGARIYAERARGELARIGGRALATDGELSATEQRIAELVAEGRSNKEVAALLSLSPKTVEWNLSKVYAKLGVRSRAELASRRR
jgi:DNA-binding CsgD family transcriptional regulator